METKVNFLEYLQSKTNVDVDSLDLEVTKTYGPFFDCTSNQADSYYEFLNPERAELLEKSVAYAKQIHHEFPTLTLQELAVELCMVTVTLTVIPYISGNIHVMANPSYSHSTSKIVENSKRIYDLAHRWDPEFDLSRLVIKVPATWEGLQACRELKPTGIKTLATTLFTIQQAITAAEAGCVSISPFVHELKVHFDETYHDVDPVFQLCVDAQRYFQHFGYLTRVKACSLINVREVMKLAGVASLTLPPSLLKDLRHTVDLEAEVAKLTMFQAPETLMEQSTYINDETKFRDEMESCDDGKGHLKTEQAIELFCGFQAKSEALMKTLLNTTTASNGSESSPLGVSQVIVQGIVA